MARAIAGLKDGKASGGYGIPAEVCKHEGFFLWYSILTGACYTQKTLKLPICRFIIQTSQRNVYLVIAKSLFLMAVGWGVTFLW